MTFMYFSLVSLPVKWRVWQQKFENESTAAPDMKTFPLTSACMDFTVMSYNILADDLLQANLDLYANCPWEVLDWNYRCMRILTEIQKWAPDVSHMHIPKKTCQFCSHRLARCHVLCRFCVFKKFKRTTLMNTCLQPCHGWVGHPAEQSYWEFMKKIASVFSCH